MAKGNFKLVGADQLRKALKNMSAETSLKVDDYLDSKAFDIQRTAVNLAPVDTGFLKNQISANTNTFLHKTITSNAAYSVYVEFGTGPHVRIPPGLEKFAAQFRGKRPGNSKAQPFFFPAYFQHSRPRTVEKELKKIILKG